jgi:hypothetical protein
MVSHPIAGVQVSVPQSRLPALFDRRYSTRRIIRNFASSCDIDDVPAELEPEQSEADSSRPFEMDFSMRRASMRQSIAPGDVPLADFLWLANVRFVDEQLVAPIPPLAEVPRAPSLCSIEISALENEIALLQQSADSLRAEIAIEEESFCGTANPLFAAVQTSEQSVLEAVQADLAQLKRVCLLQAESDALEAALKLAANARSTFRQIGEQALRDTKQIYSFTGQMHLEREVLRAAKTATLSQLLELQRKQEQRKTEQDQASARSKILGSVFECLTHCRVESMDDSGVNATLDVCDTVRLVTGPDWWEVSLIGQSSSWKLSVLQASNVLGRRVRESGVSLLQIVRNRNNFCRFFICFFTRSSLCEPSCSDVTLQQVSFDNSPEDSHSRIRKSRQTFICPPKPPWLFCT